MIELFQYPCTKEIPNLNPFCLKVETFLRISHIPYKICTETDRSKSPNKKLPYIRDGEKIVYDTEVIIEYLKDKYILTLDSGLMEKQKSISLSFEYMLDRRFYWLLLYYRWFEESGYESTTNSYKEKYPLAYKIMLFINKYSLKKELIQQNIDTQNRTKVFIEGKKILNAISCYLEDKKFFHGSEASAIDATIFAFLSNVYFAQYDSSLKQHMVKLENLCLYCVRIEEYYFSGPFVKEKLRPKY